MRRLAPLALALIVSGSVGCAISRDALDRLHGEVGERNAARRRTAGAELAAEGYVDAEAPTARLAEVDRARCVSRDLDDAPMRVDVDGAPASTLSAEPEATCAFFRRRVERLEARTEAGEAVTLHSTFGRGLMRAPDGERVLVRFELRTVETHEVLVDMDCDHMPRVPPDELAYGPAALPVVAAEERPREVTRVVEQEDVDVECTRNTY